MKQGKVYVEYQFDLGRVDGDVAYILRWRGDNIGKAKKDKGWKGQIFLDRGDAIKQCEAKGQEIVYLNWL